LAIAAWSSLAAPALASAANHPAQSLPVFALMVASEMVVAAAACRFFAMA
jgi:hypothetical protein